MPRRAAKNVFDLNREADVDAPSTAESLGSILPKVSDLPAPPARTAARATEPEPRPDRSRRPIRKPAARREGTTRVPARIPNTLYDAAVLLVQHTGGPSWGQLVAWTCEDHADDVASEAVRLAVEAADPRRPRGQNRPRSATIQVTPRLNAGELASLDSVRQTAKTEASKAEAAVDDVTRTTVVCAALTIAIRQRSE